MKIFPAVFQLGQRGQLKQLSHNRKQCLREIDLNRIITTPCERQSLPWIILTNVRSLRNKIDELSVCCQNVPEYKRVNCIIITETWLQENTSDAVCTWMAINFFEVTGQP